MYKKIKAENILIIILALVLVIIVVVIIYVNDRLHTQVRKAISQQARSSLITPTPESFPSISYPSPTPNDERVDETVYDTKSLDRVVEKVENRKPLSESDAAVKGKVLSLLPQGETSGTLYASSNIIIDYIYGDPDHFQVEIITTDITQAKNEGIKWFVGQGFSQDFTCNYPVAFYLSFDVKNQLSNSTLFSALPPNCQ